MVEVRKENGNHYPLKTLHLLLCGLHRYVKEHIIFRWITNVSLNDSIFAILPLVHTFWKLHQHGIACATKKKLLSREDDAKLCQTGVLKPDTHKGHSQGLLIVLSFSAGEISASEEEWSTMIWSWATCKVRWYRLMAQPRCAIRTYIECVWAPATHNGK